ncbi:MAG: preprotein translocase subunit SecA [Elusimicrobiota bacterium]
MNNILMIIFSVIGLVGLIYAIFNFQSIINAVIGTPSERKMKKLQTLVDKVNSLEDSMLELSDEQLKEKRDEFKERYNEGENLEELMPEAFAVVREVCRRKVDMRHFNVQLKGGAVLFEGNISEMSTGEGKTLVAILPAYLQSISGTSVHIITVNDYLAKRDAEWMGPAYRSLGMSVGFVQSDMKPRQRKENYNSDVVYITNNEIGFDYLRDNMARSPEQQVQGNLEYAIIDEVDSVLIDEARTPLIISGPSGKSSDKYHKVHKIMKYLKIRFITEDEAINEKHKFEESGKKGDYRDELEKDYDAIIYEDKKDAHLTERGTRKCEELLDVNLFDDVGGEWLHHIKQALKAEGMDSDTGHGPLFKKEDNYIVKDGKVVIVDEFTGRLMPGRRWSDGLHQAVEAKENLKTKRENQTLATITFQNFFNLYDKLAGMTGTALTEQAEFHGIYDLKVFAIPTNKPLKREEMPDSIYQTEEEKFEAIIEAIKKYHREGRPLLVGSRSIEVSEKISARLKRKGIKHNVLNAKHHMREAEIVAQAGRKEAVTISTNMAGRGTDIVLGGNPDYMARREMERNDWEHNIIVKAAEKTAPKTDEEEEAKKVYNKYFKQFKKETDREHKEVVELGGLHVIGTERHESRRIDNQLRGRAGRQGDPGSSRFYVSLEDELMRLFGSEKITKAMDTLGGLDRGEKIEHPLISRAISRAQKRIEGMNFQMRKKLLEYDNVMDKQRKSIYFHRNRLLRGEHIEEELLGFIEDYVDMILEQTKEVKRGRERVQKKIVSEKQHPEQWDTDYIESELVNTIGLNIDIDSDDFISSKVYGLRKMLETKIKEFYNIRKKKMGEEDLKDMARVIMIQIIDARWKDHLRVLDQIKESVTFSGYAGKDPIIEYKQKSFEAFTKLMDTIKKEVLIYLFRASSDVINSRISGYQGKEVKPEAKTPDAANKGDTPQNLSGGRSRGQNQNKVKQRVVDKDVGRNDPCPCGSGKKYKHCCGR